MLIIWPCYIISFDIKMNSNIYSIFGSELLTSTRVQNIFCNYFYILTDKTNHNFQFSRSPPQFNLLKDHSDLPLWRFLTAVEMTLSATYFQFMDKHYQQNFGCAMGSSISEVAAQLVMEELKVIIQKYNLEQPLFGRYAHDWLYCRGTS